MHTPINLPDYLSKLQDQSPLKELARLALAGDEANRLADAKLRNVLQSYVRRR